MLERNKIMKLNLRPVLGADVGLSLVLLQAASHHEITPSLVMCDLALCHSIYGRDRLKDQIRDQNLQYLDTECMIFNVSTSLATVLAIYFMLKYEHNECIPLIVFLSNCYHNTKRHLGISKSFVIGILWAYTIIFVPPEGGAKDLFCMYSAVYSGASNLADIKDVEDDRRQNIRTIPVSHGVKATYDVSAILASIALSFHTPSVQWTLGDFFIEIMSGAMLIYCSAMSFISNDKN